MKEVPKKDLPEISGGEDAGSLGQVPTAPYFPPSIDYPRQPFGPVVEMPENEIE